VLDEYLDNKSPGYLINCHRMKNETPNTTTSFSTDFVEESKRSTGDDWKI